MCLLWCVSHSRRHISFVLKQRLNIHCIFSSNRLSLLMITTFTNRLHLSNFLSQYIDFSRKLFHLMHRILSIKPLGLLFCSLVFPICFLFQPEQLFLLFLQPISFQLDSISLLPLSTRFFQTPIKALSNQIFAL